VNIDGAVAVVTGAGSGIGRSIAARLASAGASVVAGDIDADSATETAAMVGGIAAAVDAASTDGIATLLDTARRSFGPVDIYVANAGIAGQLGLLTQLGAAPYTVTKHAAVGFAEWLAIKYGDKGIGVSCVCPMGVDTPLLRGMAESPDAEMRLAAAAVTSAGAVTRPDSVADLVVQAITNGNFLVLPHPEVLTMYRQKGADYERWIAGMRRYRRTLQ
jgi:NAD(P)-dependent dehydrogenase (short-subunit alcohol dehydrogenase family)